MTVSASNLRMRKCTSELAHAKVYNVTGAYPDCFGTRVYVCVYVCVCMCVCVIQNVRVVLSKGTSLCREQCARVNESRAQIKNLPFQTKDRRRGVRQVRGVSRHGVSPARRAHACMHGGRERGRAREHCTAVCRAERACSETLKNQYGAPSVVYSTTRRP